MKKRIISILLSFLFPVLFCEVRIPAAGQSAEAPISLVGDVDRNGVIDAADARLALRAVIGLDPIRRKSRAFFRADADNNGLLQAADARLILRAAVGLETLQDWLLTEFTRENLWYTKTGALAGGMVKGVTSYSHSQKIPVIAGQKLYGAFFADLPAKCAGAFFDAKGNWIAPILIPTGTPGVNAEIYRYSRADVTPAHTGTPAVEKRGGLRYCVMHEITVPQNAAYVSVNLNDGMKTVSSDNGTHVRTLKNVQSLSTLPMLGVTGSGNRIWRYGDPKRAVKGDKKLYIIGPSTASIDRAYRSVYNARKAPDAADNNTIEPIVGFQEYLIPYYREVVTLAFSGCPYRYDSETDPRSIYMYLTGKTDPACALYAEPQKYLGNKKNDLSDADEVLILANNNRLSKEEDLGTFDSRDIRTYCGAINLLVDHILAKNTGHKVDIWLCLRPGRPGTKFSALTNEANHRIAEARGLKIADVSNIGITEENYRYYTYDSQLERYSPYGLHFNNEGNMKFGLALADVLLSDDPAAHTPTQTE